jgi:hypothetical protein
MVSNTQQTRRIRRNRNKKMGKQRKRQMAKRSTPLFAIHPEGYDSKAPDAKKGDD